MWQQLKYYFRTIGAVLGLIMLYHLPALALSESDMELERDSLLRVVHSDAPADDRMNALSRLSLLYMQTPDEVNYLEQEYQLALDVDSIENVYDALHNLARYYYNNKSSHDSLMYWVNQLDSIARSRNEYPDVLFDVKSYSCLDLLWKRNAEMALEEAMAMYQLATEVKHPYGLSWCAQNLGLIYQSIRRDQDAVASFQEALDLLVDLDVPDKLMTQLQLASYQVESSLRTPQHAQTDSILDKYKQYTDQYLQICTMPSEMTLAKREYWLLYCYYANLYLLQNQPAKAKVALDKAAEYVGNVIAEGDYVENVYLEVKALYYYRTGNPLLALQCLDEVLARERLLENLQLKADILESLGRHKEALVLYDEIFQISSQKNDESFMRQINQLQTQHDLYDKKVQARQLELNQQRMADKRRLVAVSSGVSSLLLLVMYILFIYYRRARGLKNELQHEKESLLDSEKKLTIAKGRAEEANLMKSTFLANMSHEIRTPLNAIVGFSSLLVEESSEPEEREEYSRIIHNNTELLLNLVNDVLDLSRMETGELAFTLKNYPLLECCQRSLDSVRHRIPEGVDLTFSPDPSPIIVYTDMFRLQQVLTNLLTNAAKFTEKGEINLAYRLEEDGEHVRITVTDTGSGIPLEKQATIFNRFEKLDDYKPGAGLGLSICTLIAERVKGTLSIDPTYTTGARFVFIHPCEKLSSPCNRQTTEEA